MAKNKKRKKKQGFFERLITKNNGFSSKSFFLVVVTIIGCILLFVPVIILCVEIYFNHTIQTDITGLAAYIGAVAAIFASAGVTKAYGERYDRQNERYDNEHEHDAFEEPERKEYYK